MSSTVNVTNFIEQTSDILSAVQTAVTDALSSSYPNDAVLFHGTSFDNLVQSIRSKRLPVAMIWYNGSEYANSPRRTLEVHVTLARSSPMRDDTVRNALLDDLWKVLAALDHELLGGDSLCIVQSDTAIDVGLAPVSVIDIELEVTDR